MFPDPVVIIENNEESVNINDTEAITGTLRAQRVLEGESIVVIVVPRLDLRLSSGREVER